MAAFDTTRPMGASTLSRTAHLISDAFGHFGAWNDERITRKTLSRLSDRELDDIGLSRSDIANGMHRRMR